MSAHQLALQTTKFSLLSNILLTIIKALAGFFGNSFALIADAVESLADVLASVLVLFGMRISIKPADKNHPYGHGRIEALLTFLNVGFLLLSAIIIAITSVRNISIPHDLPKPFTLIILFCIIAWKELSFRKVRKAGIETNSSLLQAEAWHHRADAITSLLAFIGIAIALIMGQGYESADDYAALCASFVIIYNSYRIFRPALAEIMDEDLHHELIEQIRSISHQIDGVINTEKCFVRKAGMAYQVDLHIIVDGNATVRHGHDIAHNLKDALQMQIPQLSSVLIHVEPD